MPDDLLNPMMFDPAFFEIGPILSFLDLLGIAVFAISGCLAAAKKGQTIVTFAFFALITGAGGGTLRDLLIDVPVFWVESPAVLIVILAVTLIMWVTPERWWQGKMLDWTDAIGLAAYAVFGAAKAMDVGIAPLPAIIMGVSTACVGGIIRDVLAGEPSIILKPEIYVAAAALAASLYVGLASLGMGLALSASIAALAGFALRGAGIQYKLGLPSYRGRNDQGPHHKA